MLNNQLPNLDVTDNLELSFGNIKSLLTVLYIACQQEHRGLPIVMAKDIRRMIDVVDGETDKAKSLASIACERLLKTEANHV